MSSIRTVSAIVKTCKRSYPDVDIFFPELTAVSSDALFYIYSTVSDNQDDFMETIESLVLSRSSKKSFERSKP